MKNLLFFRLWRFTCREKSSPIRFIGHPRTCLDRGAELAPNFRMVYMLYRKLCRHFKENPSLPSCHLFSWQGREERKTLLFARLFFFFKSVSTMSVRTYGTVLFGDFATIQCMLHALLIQLRYGRVPCFHSRLLERIGSLANGRRPEEERLPTGWHFEGLVDLKEIPSPDAVFIHKAVGHIIRVYRIDINSPLSLIQEKR